MSVNDLMVMMKIDCHKSFS